MSPTSSTISTTQRPLKSSSRSPPATAGPRTCLTRNSTTIPSAERSLHHCSLRSEKIQRAVDHSPDESLLSSQSLSVGHVTTGRPVSHEFGSLISNVRENPRPDPENEQISNLLERQKVQILADCRAEFQKHGFQVDYDRRNIQKLNEVIQSQRGEIYRNFKPILTEEVSKN